MRNPFRRRQRFDDDAKQKLIRAIAGMLEVQQAAAGGRTLKDEGGRINRKALGYIYGFVDAAVTSVGQDIPAVFFPTLYQVLRYLCPDREERYPQFLTDHIGNDELVILGAMKGRQQ